MYVPPVLTISDCILYLSFLHDSQFKQGLFTYAAFTSWSLMKKFCAFFVVWTEFINVIFSSFIFRGVSMNLDILLNGSTEEFKPKHCGWLTKQNADFNVPSFNISLLFTIKRKIKY